jgi:ribosomal protein S12 methylthiotransferase accessory factor
MRFFAEDLSQPKRFRDGTHRACAPAETLGWLIPKARSIGMTRVANVTGLDVIGVPVWVAIRPNSRGLSTSQGKGLSDDAARASAVMESVEGWHAETIDRPVRICDHATIGRHGAAVDPESLCYYRDTPPRPDLAISWIEGFDLASELPCWVPLECVSTDYVVKADGGLPATFVQSSNGLAGGNHLLEAIDHALTELIERHALAASAEEVRGFAPRLRVDPATVDDPGCREVLARLDSAGMLAAIFALPSAFGIPAFACSIMEADSGQRLRVLPPFNGYGCHLEPGIALLRALTEAVQSRATFISGSRDDISVAEYIRSGSPDDLHSYRTLFGGGAELRFGDILGEAKDSFEADVRRLIERLGEHGHDQVVIVDLRKPGMDVPVVKAVVPGLALPETLIRGRPIRVPALKVAEAA